MHPLALNVIHALSYAVFTTAPERIQRVQTLVLLVLPPAPAIRTVLRLGSQRRLDLLCAWDTLLPVTGPLPHISHTLAIFFSFYQNLKQTEPEVGYGIVSLHCFQN